MAMAEITKPAAIILVLISILFLAALMPTIIDHVQGVDYVNTTSWNFTGHSGAATLWLIIPLLIIAGATLGYVKDLI